MSIDTPQEHDRPTLSSDAGAPGRSDSALGGRGDSRSPASGTTRSVAVGSFWMILLKACESALGIVSTAILARLLMPEDFGLVAMAMSVIFFLDLLSAFGFDWALIQKRDATREHYHTAWTFNVILRSGSGALLVLLAVPTAVFFDDGRVAPVMVCMAANSVIQGFVNIGTVAFRKDFKFHMEFALMFGRKLLGFAVTIPLAFALRNYWALVIGTVSASAAMVGLSFMLHPFRPRFSLQRRGDLFHFSKWLLFNNILSYFNLRAAHLIIGKVSGSTVLGAYTLASEIAEMLTVYIVGPVNRVVFSGYAKESGDTAALGRTFLNILSMVALVIVPASVGMVVVADEVVYLWLGEKWAMAAPILKVLVVNGMAMALLSNISYIFLAMGKPRLNTFFSAAYMAVLMPLLFYGTLRMGALGAAWAFLAATIAIGPVYLVVLVSRIALAPSRLWAAIWRPMIASLFMYPAVSAGMARYGGAGDNLHRMWNLSVWICAGAAIYVLVDSALWVFSGKPDGAERFLVDKILPRIRKRLPMRRAKST